MKPAEVLTSSTNRRGCATLKIEEMPSVARSSAEPSEVLLREVEAKEEEGRRRKTQSVGVAPTIEAISIIVSMVKNCLHVV